MVIELSGYCWFMVWYCIGDRFWVLFMIVCMYELVLFRIYVSLSSSMRLVLVYRVFCSERVVGWVSIARLFLLRIGLVYWVKKDGLV